MSSTNRCGAMLPMAKSLVNTLSFLYRAAPSAFFNDWTTSLPASILSVEGGTFNAEAEGGGNWSILSIGGGFFGAKNESTLFDFLPACDVGGGGKSEKLVSEGYATLPSLSLRACA